MNNFNFIAVITLLASSLLQSVCLSVCLPAVAAVLKTFYWEFRSLASG